MGFLAVLGGIVDIGIRKKHPVLFQRQNLVQYLHTVGLLVLMIAVPVKVLLKLVFDIKYVWVTPWFNV